MDRSKPFIIAEIGSNWRRFDDEKRNETLAYRQIFDAAACGVDAVKFQFFTHRELYGIPGDTARDLPLQWLPKLAFEAKQLGVQFLCSAFSPRGVLAVDPFVLVHKIASCEANDPEMISAVIGTGKDVLVSTGALVSEEINQLIDRFERSQAKLHLMACVASYPAQVRDYTLLPGTEALSDHTLSSELALVAIGRGAFIFEKHFDCLANLKPKRPIFPSPDSPVSIGIEGLKEYVTAIRTGFSAVDPHGKIKFNRDAEIHKTWKRRLKITKMIKGGQDTLENGVNFGSFRSLEPDTRAAAPSEIYRFEGRRVKKDMKPQDGLYYDDIE